MAFVLLLVFSTLSSSAPTVNQSNMDPHLSHPVLRDVPNGPEFVRYRTTSQIVWACLSTIFACSWVAIHPNIPGPHDSGFQKFRRRITMMNATILALEFIVLWALRQRTVAKRTKKRFNDKYFGGVDPEAVSCISQIKQWFKSPPPAPAPGWTLTHAFFVQMGGLMAYHDGEPVKVLTFERLVQSIDRGEVDIPQIFIEEISDKSKGDLLSKSAVVVQTSWFVAQCVTRWWSHLPLSDLEVFTLGFAALNAFVFWIWWHKPQGVMVPIRVVLKQAPKQDPVATLPESPKPLPTIADKSNGSQTEDASEYLFDKESRCFPRVAWPLWQKRLREKCESIGPSPFFHCVCFYISLPFLFLFTLIHWITRTAVKTIMVWHYPVKSGTKEVLVAEPTKHS
ncbi:hypothetical protein D9756_007242 [Leucocoprinus leucothites]|uniref:Uncharacterized protein n=1 Tax=Leucocoprinus leucothites TaxID=201217 RepID=A0A8H5FXZ9_9AGAR|nr:hypothetical protein D9756_007242 [Leucoagaricus leucothites]